MIGGQQFDERGEPSVHSRLADESAVDAANATSWWPSAHARQRGPGERANAQLKSWKIVRRIRC